MVSVATRRCKIIALVTPAGDSGEEKAPTKFAGAEGVLEWMERGDTRSNSSWLCTATFEPRLGSGAQAMSDEPAFKVVRINCTYEVLSRCVNLIIARGAYREPARMYPEDKILLC
jgi:hypothetical protein